MDLLRHGYLFGHCATACACIRLGQRPWFGNGQSALRIPLESSVTTVVLLCAVLAGLAGGVLLAYGLANAMFYAFRIHSIQAAQQRLAQREAAQMAAASMDLAL